jgi:3-hydroxyisobutyrate dehydrogenase-like beta-hydroxyacid dehydrogenase
MTIATVGLLHPGSMGAAVGKVLTQAGRTVVWASEGRSPESGARAQAAGLEDAGAVTDLAAHSDLVLSICPPHGALDTA